MDYPMDMLMAILRGVEGQRNEVLCADLSLTPAVLEIAM